MKVMTVLGTRPEIIRLSLIIKKLDKISNHILINTGQNFEDSLNKIFFEQLDLRTPDYSLVTKSNSFGEQSAKIISGVEKILIKEKPDRLLILGDTNSGLSCIPAKRLGVTIFHMEAGNRCYDDKVPEEVNRRIIDHTSDILLPYTNRSKENLVREGIAREKIFVTGNPIFEVMQSSKNKISGSKILSKLHLKKKKYFLVTMHRAENVDSKERLTSLMLTLNGLTKKYKQPVVISLHPRTKSKISKIAALKENTLIRFIDPPGFFDFIELEKNSFCVLSDSGTVQEECCIMKVPNVTIRDVTERPETIECGSCILSGVNEEKVLSCVQLALNSKCDWVPPLEYTSANVSDTVTKIITGY